MKLSSLSVGFASDRRSFLVSRRLKDLVTMKACAITTHPVGGHRK